MKDNTWYMKIENKLTEDPEAIADTFNSFFVKKIEDLKANIDPNLVTDPLSKLKADMKENQCSFELKTVGIKELKKSIKTRFNHKRKILLAITNFYKRCS